MPRKYYKKRPRRKYNRRYKRRNNANKLNSVTIPRNRVQPDRLFVKLSYNDIKLITSLAGGSADYVYRANSLFDPDFTGTGEQPVGFDEWSAFYNRYRIHACKINLKFIMTNSTSPDNAVGVSITPANTSSPLGLFEDIIGNAYSKWEVLGPNTGMSKTELTNYINIGKFQGKSGAKYDDVNSAPVNDNPSRQTYWHVSAQTMSTAGGPITSVRYIARITYFCEFFDRKTLEES